MPSYESWTVRTPYWSQWLLFKAPRPSHVLSHYISGPSQLFLAALSHLNSPVIPEVNSPWFQLFIYHLCDSGPPSILYPKGTTVTQIHPHFQVFCASFDSLSLIPQELHHCHFESVGSWTCESRCRLPCPHTQWSAALFSCPRPGFLVFSPWWRSSFEWRASSSSLCSAYH